MRKVLLIIFFTFITVISFAASMAMQDMKFRHIGLDDGLSHSTVPSIAQDSLGYMWFATHDGLNRYDGYSFKVYRHDAEQSASISDNILCQVLVDSKGRLWITGGKGLSEYRRESDNFRNYSLPDGHNAIALAEIDPRHLLVSGGGGLYKFDIDKEEFTRVKLPPEVGKGPVNSMVVDGNTVWLGHDSGRLLKTDLSTGKTTVTDFKASKPVNMLLQGPDRALWIATDGDGLFRYVPSGGKWLRVDDLGNDLVRSLGFDSDGRLWAGSFLGLDIVDTRRIKTVGHIRALEESGGLSQSSVRSIYRDGQGGMWLGTYFGGLNYFHPLQNQFSNLQFSHLRPSLNDNVAGTIVEGPDGCLYIGTNSGGLNIYNPADASFRHYTTAQGLKSNDVKAVYIHDGKAYIGTHLGGMSVLDTESGQVTALPGLPRNVFSIVPADQGRLWLAFLNAAGLYDPADGSCNIIRQDIDGNPLTPANIHDIYRDNEGRLWIYGREGAAVYREKNRALQPLHILDTYPELAGQNITIVTQTSDGIFWIGSRSGLYRLDMAKKNLRHFTVADGLPNDIVYGIAEGGDGRLWISTNGGLASYDPTGDTFWNYSLLDGLPSNQFSEKSYCRASDGRLYFGSINGITAFNPKTLAPNPYSPAPIITGLRLFNTLLEPGDDSGVLKSGIEGTRSIRLKPDQTMLTIDFAVCNYVAGAHNRFAYKLEGLDRDWHYTGDQRSVTYSRLPAGKYRFLVKSANNDGVWSSDVTSLEIYVMPHWYDSWWARTLFVLIGIVIVWLVMRQLWQRRAMRQQLEFEKLDKERQQELNEMKVRFFINMSHELRTPLTLIMLPVSELLQRNNAPRTQTQLETVRHNAMRMLHIVNQILDFRRAELGMFKLQVTELDVNDYAGKICANFRRMAENKKINFSFDSTLGDTRLPVDPVYLDLIMSNLLSNAFKFTPEGESVRVKMEVEDHRLVIHVSDTGCGIPADRIDKIFARFYQVSDGHGGSGVGLSLVRRLTELHHGGVSVTSTVGEGSDFTIWLPADPAAYSPDETRAQNTSEPQPNTPADLIDEAMLLPGEEFPHQTAEGLPPQDAPSILVVDDNAAILKYLGSSLGSEYRVIQAENGSKALDLLATEKIDLIITDVMMPDMDGIQLCKAVKRNLRTSHIPVIMLSAKTNIEDQLDGMKVGADDYLPKPFSMPLLVAKIKNQFRTRAMALRNYSASTVIEPEKMAQNPLDEEFLRRAMEVMEKHIDDTQFSTDEFARCMFMSRSNLHLKMKALTGETTNEFIKRVRLNKAMELLKSNRYTVSEVSSMVGYGTPSYFATSFKKFYGSSPSDFVRKDTI